jgi:two-component system cell cycle sensor histidine kinase/response regulator CckA
MDTSAQWLVERVVLVVDDEEAVRHYTARVLTGAGFGVLEAQDGAEAVAMLAKLGPTVIGLVVSDIAMPRMTGEELAATMVERWPTVPIILVSGHGGPRAGYQGQFLWKPFLPDSLLAAIASLASGNGSPCASHGQ